MIGGLAAFADRVQLRRGLAGIAIIALPFWMIVAPGFARALDTAVAAALIAVTIKWIVDNPRSRPARLLSSKPLSTLGTISYSLYLWQQLFFGPPTAVLHAWPVLPVVVYASWRFIELPSLRLKNRVTRAKPLPAASVSPQNNISPLSTVTAWPDM